MTDNPEVQPGQQENDDKEREYRKRHQYREGQTQLEIISTGTEKHQILDAARTLMNGFEDMSLHPDGSTSEYRLEDAIAVVGNRKADMSYLRQDLADLGYLQLKKNEKNGEVEETLVFPGFAYTTKIEATLHARNIYDAQRQLVRTEVEEEPNQIFIAGTDDERKGLNQILAQVQSEMTGREDLVKKLRWVWNQTENLEGLVQFYFMGSLTAESMNDLCNAESRTIPGEIDKGERMAVLTKTEGGAEYRKGHELGDATSVALQCLEIAAFSEKPAELKALLERPGIKFLFNVSDQDINDLFLDPDHRKNPDSSVRPIKETLKNWIGEPWAWKENNKKWKENYEKKEGHPFSRSSKDDLEKPIFKIELDGTEVRNEDGLRGRLTDKGNILCKSEWSHAEIVFEQIERFLGGGKDSKSVLAKKDARDARFIAWGELRTTGMGSDLGGQPYHYKEDKNLGRPEGDYTFHEMGGMTSCYRVKVISPEVFRKVYRYLKSEIRAYGPEGSLGKYPDRFTVPYFKTWAAKIKYDDEKKMKWVKPDSRGEKKSLGERTFQEMRWGYRAEKETDVLTGQIKDLPEEPAYRLGELPWVELSPKAYNAAALGPFIAGREKVGIYQHIMRTDYDIRELKVKDFFEKLAQYAGISFNLQTVRDGKFRGVYNGDDTHDANVGPVVKNEIRNYKKKFFTAFWDGIRSLPQYREWLAGKPDETKDKAQGGSPIYKDPIKRIKYRLGRIGIFTMEEAMKLPTEALNQDDLA